MGHLNRTHTDPGAEPGWARSRACFDSMMKSFVKSRMPDHVRRAARHLADEWQVHRLHVKSVKRARSLSTFPLQLNLGSGFNPKPGWVNVDLGHETADLQL